MAGIFKAYDIRGIVGEGLTPECAYLIGRGLAHSVYDGAGPIIVSRDMRNHSPQLSSQLVRGLRNGGCDVLDIGLAATPMNYWANVHYAGAGSVMVTASHNGPAYNGFKVSGRGALPLDYATGLDLVEAFVAQAQESGNAALPATKCGTLQQVQDALPQYLDFMDKFVQRPATGKGRKLKIDIDAANGMAGFFLPGFFERYDWLEVVPLYWELDGAFPNHEADPLKPENLVDVQSLVVENNCDFGVAYDGDADRCMFIDEAGRSISSDLITAFISGEILLSTPNRAILYDLRSSRVVAESIAQHGGVPVRGRVGHSFMKRLLREKQAPFGGELSGHYYFADCFNTDSGLMAMIQVMNIWQKQQGGQAQTLSQLIAPLRKYSATGELNFHVSDVASVLKYVEQQYSMQKARIDHLDGLTVEFDEWWFNLRSSNTEPLLRLNLEAQTEAQRDARLAEVKQLIAR